MDVSLNCGAGNQYAELLRSRDARARYEKLNRRIGLEGILGTLISGVLAAIAANMGWITSHLPVMFRLVLLVLLAAAAVGLYVLRTRARIAYASLEIPVGLTMLLMAVQSAIRLPVAESENDRNLWLIQLAGGLYVAVRGLNNFFSSPTYQEFQRTAREKRRRSQP